MNAKVICIFLLTTICTAPVWGQKKKKQKSSKPATEEKSTSVAPYYPKEDYAPKEKKRNRKKKGWVATYDARDEFYDRMELNWKEREKKEKNASGVRSVDKSQPPYFGHKRPPKKRPPEKMKFCKVCGIRH
jgi:hypothetical protein